MEKRVIGGPGGLEVSLVGLGCNAFGRRVNEAGTHAVLDKAIDAGIDFLDTAETYGDGQSEAFMGTGLVGKRDKVFIASKFGFSKSHVEGKKKGSAENIQVALDISLTKLKTDWIDLYQLHRPDPETPVVETMGELEDQVNAGNVRYYGCSFYSGQQMQEAVDEAKRANLKGFVTAQNAWNVLLRDIEDDLVPVCEDNGVTLLPYYPIAKGILTGKYRRGGAAPSGSRLEYERDLAEADFDVIEALEAYAKDHGHELLTLAISWLASQLVTVSVIAGGSNPKQMAANAAAAQWKMTETQLSEIDQIVLKE